MGGFSMANMEKAIPPLKFNNNMFWGTPSKLIDRQFIDVYD